tara:strand:- start:286 stop:831 length:546 start_codon:yes stop_codon:yes gene_type:complete
MIERQKRIPLFSEKTAIGTWLVSCDRETLDISHVSHGFSYYLTNSQFPDFELVSTKDLYDLIRAVAQHRTGLEEWDGSTEAVSDYVRDWKEEYDDRLLINLTAEYLQRREGDSIREMVDYFEHKHSYMLDREKLKELLQQMMLTGEIKRLPSFDMAPSEMKSLQRLERKWRDSDNGSPDRT